MVAYCTRSGHGARIIASGAITGVQVLKTSAYTQWTGFINQTALGLLEDDSGGELDPHGADVSLLSSFFDLGRQPSFALSSAPPLLHSFSNLATLLVV